MALLIIQIIGLAACVICSVFCIKSGNKHLRELKQLSKLREELEKEKLAYQQLVVKLNGIIETRRKDVERIKKRAEEKGDRT